MELRKEIQREIREEIGRFIETHTNMSFRFEYSDLRCRFLVSYHFNVPVDEEDPIWDDVLDLEDYFYDKFHDDAPLFSEDNRIFKLSPAAQTITPVKPVRPISVRVPIASPSILSKTVRLNK